MNSITSSEEFFTTTFLALALNLSLNSNKLMSECLQHKCVEKSIEKQSNLK